MLRMGPCLFPMEGYPSVVPPSLPCTPHWSSDTCPHPGCSQERTEVKDLTQLPQFIPLHPSSLQKPQRTPFLDLGDFSALCLRVRGPASSPILGDKDQGSRDLGIDRLGKLQRWEWSCSGNQVTCWKRSWETPAGPCPLRGQPSGQEQRLGKLKGSVRLGLGPPAFVWSSLHPAHTGGR